MKHHLVRVVHDVDKEDGQVLHRLGEQLCTLHLLLGRGLAAELVLSRSRSRLGRTRVVHLCEEESEREGNGFSNLPLDLRVQLLVFVLPDFRNNQEVLDEPLKSVQPEVRALLGVGLLDRDADYVHERLHKRLLDHIGAIACLG